MSRYIVRIIGDNVHVDDNVAGKSLHVTVACGPAEHMAQAVALCQRCCEADRARAGAEPVTSLPI